MNGVMVGPMSYSQYPKFGDLSDAFVDTGLGMPEALWELTAPYGTQRWSVLCVFSRRRLYCREGEPGCHPRPHGAVSVDAAAITAPRSSAVKAVVAVGRASTREAGRLLSAWSSADRRGKS